MKALIVGGGVAGPATGLALAKAGIAATVLERRIAPDPEVGSYLTIAPNGLDALAAIDALDPVLREGFHSRTNAMYGATGRRLGEVSLGAPRAGELVAWTLKRSKLAVCLAQEAAGRGVTVRYGARVDDVRDEGDRVVARLDDGSELHADLLVGADGVHSRIRRAIDPGAPHPRYVGLTNFGGVTHGTPVAHDLEPEAWHFIFGSRCFFGAHPGPDGSVAWFVNVPEPEIARAATVGVAEHQWRERLLDLVRDDAGPATELVKNGKLELAADNIYDLGHVPTWSRGRILILGDAAHAPSPSSGQGASMALEDAVVLAQALRDNHDVPTSFDAFERTRRRRVEKIVAAGARSSSSKIPGPVGRRFQELALRLVFRYAVTDRSTAWMNGHRTRWTDTVR